MLVNLTLVNSVSFLLFVRSPVVQFGCKLVRTRPNRSPGAALTPPGPQDRPEITKTQEKTQLEKPKTNNEY